MRFAHLLFHSDVGDAALALSCMFALGASTGYDDKALMQGLSFAAARSVLLLQMFASSLQVIQSPHLLTFIFKTVPHASSSPSTSN